jgi:hypothetical protein
VPQGRVSIGCCPRREAASRRLASRDLGRGARQRVLSVAIEIAADGPLAGRLPAQARSPRRRPALSPLVHGSTKAPNARGEHTPLLSFFQRTHVILGDSEESLFSIVETLRFAQGDRFSRVFQHPHSTPIPFSKQKDRVRMLRTRRYDTALCRFRPMRKQGAIRESSLSKSVAPPRPGWRCLCPP